MDGHFAGKAVRATAETQGVSEAMCRAFSAEGVRSQPISGLLAAGDTTVWLDIGGGHNGGIATLRGLLQGYLAARAMAG